VVVALAQLEKTAEQMALVMLEMVVKVFILILPELQFSAVVVAVALHTTEQLELEVLAAVEMVAKTLQRYRPLLELP
jgi:hypothetical protein